MKNIICIAVILIAMSNSVSAQSSFQIVEQQLPYNHTATSFTADFIGFGEDFIAYNWEKFIEDHGGTTYVTSHGLGDIELRSEKVKFPLLNNQEVDVYSRLSPNDVESGVLLTLWIRTKDGTYFSSKTHPEKAKEIKGWFLKFHKNLEALNDKIVHE